MISRWRSPTLTRNIYASLPDYPAPAGASLILAHKDLSPVCEGEQEKKIPENPASKTSSDPWAPIFDNISTDTPPTQSPRHNLPTRFFTSRPPPKSFFSSNMSRSSPQSGSGSRRREYGTHSKERDIYTSEDRLGKISAWDHMFEGVVDREQSLGSFGPCGVLSSTAFSSTRRPKRKPPTMTAREISAFDKMFDMIFTAVSDKRRESFTTAAVQVESTSRQPHNDYNDLETSSTWDMEKFGSSASTNPDSADLSTQVGLFPTGAAFDLFGRLRRQSNSMRQTSATAELLDRQKEEVELCETDQQLLEWTVREVFKENHIPESDSLSLSPSSSTSPSSHSSEEIARYIDNPTYPYILAHVMRTFRTKYNDPHTALALFAYAKHRSIYSYVFGCTTPAYNELLETRWELDGALKAIEEVLVEMRANGVRPDKITRTFMERARRDVGERFLSRKEDDLVGDVWEVLARVESLVANRKSERGGGKAGDRGDNGKDTKLEAKKRHWNEEWKVEAANASRQNEDRLTLA